MNGCARARAGDAGLSGGSPRRPEFGDTVRTYLEKDFGETVVKGITGGGNAIKGAVTGLGNRLFAKDGPFGSALIGGVGKLFGSEGVMGSIGKSLGGMVPMIGSFVGPAMDMLAPLFGKLFGGGEEATKVSPLRDEFFKLQGGIETLNPRVEQLTGNLSMVQAVFDAKTVETYNAAIGNLNTLFEQEQTALGRCRRRRAAVRAHAQGARPGAGEGQELDKQAQQLYKDFELLTAAGVKNTVVTKKMADAVNAYVNDARKMGVAGAVRDEADARAAWRRWASSPTRAGRKSKTSKRPGSSSR